MPKTPANKSKKTGRKILATAMAKVTDLRPWSMNPRKTTDSEVLLLGKQIKELGSYKPIIVAEDGTVLGGHARLRALQEIGEARVWVSIVQATTDADKLFYALSDNDIVGRTEKDKLLKLLGEVSPEAVAMYTVDFGFGQPITSILAGAGIDVDAGATAEADPGGNITIISLPFAAKDFEKVMAFLARIMDDHDLDSNTAAVIHLLNEYAEV